MKQSPKMQRIEENMNPGTLSSMGFLGDDKRNLTEILYDDNQMVLKLNITHEQIANRLEYFTREGESALGNTILVDEVFEVTVDDHRGILVCPFADDFKSRKRNTRLVNRETNETLYWSDLNIHMIRTHGFYEGRGSDFRIEPIDAKRILKI